jgi:hypothetical protein
MKRIMPLSASLITNRNGWLASKTIFDTNPILVIMTAAAIEEHHVLSPL